ncbi:hypothetical protein OF83DRAFT_209928 [Amylostereum chailletii]|nr:hypothetical protein OF83DRAFT_209928 [Amylostereum chailletii]
MSPNDRLMRLAGLDAMVLHLDSLYPLDTSAPFSVRVAPALASCAVQPEKLPFQLVHPVDAKEVSDVCSSEGSTSLESLDWISYQANDLRRTDSQRYSTPASSFSSSCTSSPISPKLRPIQDRPPTPSFYPTSPVLTSPPPPNPERFSDHSPPSSPSYHDESALSHPNSPYMPWSASIRSQIFHPMTSSSTPTIPDPLNRPAVCAPEFCGSSDEGDMATQVASLPSKRALARATRALRSLGGAVKKNLGGMTRRMSKYIRSKPDVIMGHSCPMIVGDLQRGSSFYRPSSIMSISPGSDFDDLKSWLEARNSVTAEDRPRGMSLDEYEASGSWLDLRGSADDELRCYPPGIPLDDETINALLSEFSLLNSSCTTFDS